MGRRTGNFKRKRTIDLNCLSKKQRKLYREGDGSRVTKKDELEKEEETEAINEIEEKEDLTDEEDDSNPYQQLVETFSAKPSGASDTDEEESEDSDDSSDESSDEAEDENKVNEKIKLLQKKLKKDLQDSDLDQEDNLDIGLKDDSESDGTDDVDTDEDKHSEEENIDDDDEEDDDDDEEEDEEDDEEEEEEDDDDDDDDDDSAKEQDASKRGDKVVNNQSDSSEDELEVLNQEEEQEQNDFSLTHTDPFIAHYERDLEEKDVDEMNSNPAYKKEDVKIPGVGDAKYYWLRDRLKSKVTHRKDRDLMKMHVKESLCKTLASVTRDQHRKEDQDGLTSFQFGLFSTMNNYQDILFTERTAANGEEIRMVYCLHALNHALKTRRRVVSNNTKIKNAENRNEDRDYRDQGLTRPKVLIVLPFRESVKRVVEMLIMLLGHSDKSLVDKKKRFFDEYGLDPDEKPKHSKKPEDFQEMFTGNCDDHFRIGIGIAKKTLKLYTEFYKADLIIASPLGLRTLIKSEGEKDRDYDFLNSIELLIFDQTDVLLMQNWEHVLHLMNHLHLQPKESHGVDFSRVRMWTLNGWSKYYRQTLVFSSYSIPEITAVFNKHCFNYEGKYVCTRKPSQGTICQVAVQVPQVFNRLDCSSYSAVADDRFNFFVKKILPQHFDPLMAQTLIYIPSYFDFVRLRNHFTREEIKYTPVNEYAREKDVNTSRNLFFQKLVPFMLYTERFHFFKRANLMGIRHVIFYGLPQYPHFYSEMCNMIQTSHGKSKGENHTCTVIYTKFEAQRLAEIVGSDRAGKMLHAEKSVHMFVTGEND